MLKPIIEFKDFTFKYRVQKEPTLKNIHLSIYPGEKVLIVGASGSGKSTLAHCINGLVPFSYTGDITGQYEIGGKNPKEIGIFGLSKIVGTVLQDTDGQFIGLTVAEDIAFALENDQVPQNEMKQRVQEVAKAVELEDFLQNAPRELSGGQKQRVSMAGIMIDDVDILLFDEPLANLDPATGKHAIELIDRITRDKEVTAIIIEHRLEDALYKQMDRIIVIGDGQIVADTTPEQLLTTNILEEQGIREPLYLTALKHAGCAIRQEDQPQHIDTMNFEPYRASLKCWYNNTGVRKKNPQPEVVLRVRDLSFSYSKEKTILSDINFDIHRGEMLAIAGKNGAGKSTLSNLICGFIQPDTGTMELNGVNLMELSIRERGEQIGLVMQNPNQMISKAMIFDEVALGLTVRGVPEEEIKERVYQTLKICGLFEFRNWPVSALSFGQKKRVTIASVLVMNPAILILDEPTAGQDYRHYTEIMEFLKRINDQYGVTILMITHDMHLMLEYTDRAIVLADGKMLADDAPAAVLTNDVIVHQAYLKRTSLYDMALRCDLENPMNFVEYFIDYERKQRAGKQEV
jgi:energy-coupling factor transport system ATP-binding protein